MIVLCLKFPSKETAHEFLYFEGSPLYINLADDNGEGLIAERVKIDGEFTLIRPADGSYCADVVVEEIPADLALYILDPKPVYRKHKFFGEH